MDSKALCRNCNFWKELSVKGECHRQSPISFIVPVYVKQELRKTLWPITESEDFCGEWEQRTEGQHYIEST